MRCAIARQLALRDWYRRCAGAIKDESHAGDQRGSGITLIAILGLRDKGFATGEANLVGIETRAQLVIQVGNRLGHRFAKEQQLTETPAP